MLPPIDWSRPWLAPLRADGEAISERVAGGASVADALDSAPSTPASDGSVPTRDNLHDFFNALVWRAQPQLKWRMNRLQAAAIARDGVGARRGPLRDALTLFDENGAMLDAPLPLVQALAARDWAGLFVQQRAVWAQARLVIVGHALLEQLATAPRKGLTAHVLPADPRGLDEAGWAAKPFCPLPVLGVPGWWDANTWPAFYDDAAVFRPPRRQAP